MLFSFRISPDRLPVSLPLLLYYHTFYIGLDFLIALARYSGPSHTLVSPPPIILRRM